MATHSSILAWRILWTEKPDWLQSTGVAKSWTPLSNTHTLSHKDCHDLHKDGVIHSWQAEGGGGVTFRGSHVKSKCTIMTYGVCLFGVVWEDILDVVVLKLHRAHLGTTTVFTDRTSVSVHISLGACTMLNQSFFRTL